jgi:hypothetical protein
VVDRLNGSLEGRRRERKGDDVPYEPSLSATSRLKIADRKGAGTVLGRHNLR